MSIGTSGTLFKQRFPAPHKGGVTVTIEQYPCFPSTDPVSILLKGKVMRTTLTIEVRYDTKLDDAERRQAFLDLAILRGRELYGQAAMLAEQAPSVVVTTIGREGKRTYPLFDGE